MVEVMLSQQKKSEKKQVNENFYSKTGYVNGVSECIPDKLTENKEFLFESQIC